MSIKIRIYLLRVSGFPGVAAVPRISLPSAVPTSEIFNLYRARNWHTHAIGCKH